MNTTNITKKMLLAALTLPFFVQLNAFSGGGSQKDIIPKFPNFQIKSEKKYHEYAYTIYENKMYEIELINYIAEVDLERPRVKHFMFWYSFDLPRNNKEFYTFNDFKNIKGVFLGWGNDVKPILIKLRETLKKIYG